MAEARHALPASRPNTAQPFLTSGRLSLVKGAPEFSHSACAVHAEQRENETLSRVRAGLRLIAAEDDRPGLNLGVESRPLPAR